MDCSSPDVSHGCAGILNASVGKGDYLGVLPGSEQGALGPTESRANAPDWRTIQVLYNAAGLLHLVPGVHDTFLGVEGHQVYCLRIGFRNRTIAYGLLAMRDHLLGRSLESPHTGPYLPCSA